MMSRPERLASFIRDLPEQCDDEDLELVIAGDFVDFLASKPYAAWTPEPETACAKLEHTMHGSFAPVFDALGQFIAGRHRLTVIIGNHDLELALPPVQDALLQRIDATPHQVHFVDDGRAYRIGRVLIEHGNRYDGANVNDWGGLRVIASALSRGEEPPMELEVSAGSQIVERVVNEIKSRYPFIDLLQPSGELLAFLLMSFEPALKWHVDKLAVLFRGGLKKLNEQGKQPPKTRYVGVQDLDQHDEELAAAYGDTYDLFRSPHEQVSWEGISDWGRLLLQGDSLSEILKRHEHVPADRLQQIRLVMRRLLLDDSWERWDGNTNQYGKAANRILDESRGQIEVVIMGHTHLARHIGLEKRARYINTGTWADIIRVPPELLEVGTDAALEHFLEELRQGTNRLFLPTYAEIRLERDGTIREARLRRAEDRP
jgi:UDP-2,3-diacylglucosamine pyrophosphatase LpxH